MKHRGDSGFAMLLVFLMAAAIAISLYWQIPRVAFQSQRQKEQLLIERGEQYKRAIQLFYRANNRYPTKLDDLENFNNRRFLRHKFKDPITGKDEWRLVHVNAAGVFTDSVLNKAKPGEQKPASTNTFVAEETYIADPTLTPQQNAQNLANRRRQSEGGAVQTLVDANGQPITPANAVAPGAPGYPNSPLPGGPPAPPLPGQDPQQPTPQVIIPGLATA
ncbi:MAG: hypothetical protein JO323_04015, partial [Acidobacteriia bacterium]|nr:hypothetical protein [Terriglobia bacterium]